MDRTLGYEPGDMGSIPVGGTTINGAVNSMEKREFLLLGLANQNAEIGFQKGLCPLLSLGRPGPLSDQLVLYSF